MLLLDFGKCTQINICMGSDLSPHGRATSLLIDMIIILISQYCMEFKNVNIIETDINVKYGISKRIAISLYILKKFSIDGTDDIYQIIMYLDRPMNNPFSVFKEYTTHATEAVIFKLFFLNRPRT